ncbi:MAG TPA: beta-ketoacyl-ACP synthase 3 [Acidimicrobiales bacterium]|nr:beta-ketoacyl-ACP synthase 3 [Acidimicrobiales bacterium]
MSSFETSTRSAVIVGVGYAVPETLRTNEEIATRLGVETEWLSRRSGTDVRHTAVRGERLDYFAARAATRALEMAGVAPDELDAVIVATTTPEEMSPHAAPLVAADIGARGAAALDVNAACVGFVTSLTLGASLIESGRSRAVVVIGADLLTQFVDYDDPQSAMLFGDGAGAVVLVAAEHSTGVGASVLHSDGDGRDLIQLSRRGQLFRMDGPAVYRQAVTMMSDVTHEVLEREGVTLDDIDLFVYHQANSRIIRAVGQHLGLPEDKVVDVVARFANTSAATLPIALGVAFEESRLHDGDRVLLGAFGAGMVWGAAIVTWGPIGATTRPR